MKTHEVEQTVLLTKSQYDKLHVYLKKHFTKTDSFQRFMMRFVKDRINVRDPLDIRYKWTSGIHELVVKKGALGSQARQEMKLSLPSNQMSHFVQLFQWLGYKNIVAIFRQTKRFQNASVEISLTTANPFYFAEVEAINATSKKQALQYLADFFAKAKLTPLSKSAYQKHLRETDRKVNIRFPLSEFPKPLLHDKTWKKRLLMTNYKKA